MRLIELEPGYILHRRPFSNTSWVLELFSKNHGIYGILARSARGYQSRFRGRLELFTPLQVCWSGSGALPTLSKAEFSQPHLRLKGEALWCGFYLNELLLRVLPKRDAHPDLYLLYEEILQQLGTVEAELRLAVLRRFEKRLLEQLGYGVIWHQEINGEMIIAERYYHYLPEAGFQRCSDHHAVTAAQVFSGRTILAFHTESQEDLRSSEAKQLIRVILERYLGDKPLLSREFWR